MMEPVIKALADDYSGQAVVIEADLDHPETALLFASYDAYYIPVFYFIDSNGDVMSSQTGLFTYDQLAALLEQTIDSAPPATDEPTGLAKFFDETLPDVIARRSLLTLLLVFIGGIVTSISPCVLTMVPLLVGYIGGYGSGSHFRGFSLSAAFVTGMALTFSILGFAAAAFGRIFGQIGTGWYYILAAVALIMGLQLAGIINLSFPGMKNVAVKKTGLSGALVMGLLFGLAASPCATPVLAVIITFAAVQGEPLYGSLLLLFYGFGHGLPLLLAGTFTGLARNLPKINKYTHYLSYASGIILILASFGLLYWIGMN